MPPSDSDLLSRYVTQRDEAAFATLVERWLPLVLGVARRRLGDDSRYAEDVAQAVFILLIRRSAVLRFHPALPGWFHLTTRRVCSQVLRAEKRRFAREAAAVRLHLMNDPGSAPDWEQLRCVLDDALLELPRADRELLFARFFAGGSFAAVGASLRLSEDAARMRCQRALERLRQLLGHRGVNSTAAALGLALAHHSAPAALASRIAGKAVSTPVAAAVAPGSLACWPGLVGVKIQLTSPAVWLWTACVVGAVAAAGAILLRDPAIISPPANTGGSEIRPRTASTEPMFGVAPPSADLGSASPGPTPGSAPRPTKPENATAPILARFEPVVAALDLPPALATRLRPLLVAWFEERRKTAGADTVAPADQPTEKALLDLLGPVNHRRLHDLLVIHAATHAWLPSLWDELEKRGAPLNAPDKRELEATWLRLAADQIFSSSGEASASKTASGPVALRERLRSPESVARFVAAAQTEGLLSTAQATVATTYLANAP